MAGCWQISGLAGLTRSSNASLTIVGSQKMLVYDDIAENKVVIFDKGVEIPPYSVTEAEFRASYKHGMANPSILCNGRNLCGRNVSISWIASAPARPREQRRRWSAGGADPGDRPKVFDQWRL